ASAKTGTWGSQGEILFSDFRQQDGGIRRATAEGGTTELAVGNGPHGAGPLWPHFLPDGGQYLYLAFQVGQGYQVLIGSLAGGEPKVLMPPSSRVAYASPGYVFFVRE